MGKGIGHFINLAIGKFLSTEDECGFLRRSGSLGGELLVHTDVAIVGNNSTVEIVQEQLLFRGREEGQGGQRRIGI